MIILQNNQIPVWIYCVRKNDQFMLKSNYLFHRIIILGGVSEDAHSNQLLPAFLTTDDFVRSKWPIYEVISHFVLTI